MRARMSITPLRRTAEMRPAGMARSNDVAVARNASSNVGGNLETMTLATGSSVRNECPRSPVTALPSQIAYWTGTGLSSPYERAISSRCSWLTSGPSPIMTSTKSPGIKCIAAKTSTEIPSNVGKKTVTRRRARYASMMGGRRKAEGGGNGGELLPPSALRLAHARPLQRVPGVDGGGLEALDVVAEGEVAGTGKEEEGGGGLGDQGLNLVVDRVACGGVDGGAALFEQAVDFRIAELEGVDGTSRVEGGVEGAVGVVAAAVVADEGREVAILPAIDEGAPLDLIEGDVDAGILQLRLDDEGDVDELGVEGRGKDRQIEPVGQSGFGQERLRLVEVTAIERQLLDRCRPIAEGGDDRTGDAALAEEDSVEDCLAVDRQTERLTDLRVIERRLRAVDAEQVVVGRLLGDDLDPLLPAGETDRSGAGERRQPDLAGADRGQPRRLV